VMLVCGAAGIAGFVLLAMARMRRGATVLGAPADPR